MTFIYAVMVEHLELLLYAFTLLAGVVPEALALLQKRRGGFRRRRRRSRGGGIFGALGALLLIFVFGGIAILVLGALALFRMIGGRRR
jgi:hypothetical protein